MNHLIWRVAAPLLLSSSSLFAAPCVTGTLQSYITGATSCSVGDVQFSAFTSVTGLNGATPIDTSTVLVTPGGSQYQPLLLLSLSQTANAGQLFDLIFRVQAAGLLTASSVTLGPSSVTGDGAVTGIVDVCAGGSFAGPGPTNCSQTSGSAAAFAISNFSQPSDRAAFATSSFFDIFFDVTLDGGLSGTAALTSASLGVEAVPEPSAIILVAMGIGAIGWLRRRG